MLEKISVKHILIGLVLLIIIYNLFFPDDFIKKTINPREYWSDRVESLSKNINFIEKALYDLSNDMTTKNYEREIREMTLDFMRQGIPQDSSLKLALNISENGIKAEKLVFESFSKSLEEHKKLLEKAKIELNKIDSRKK